MPAVRPNPTQHAGVHRVAYFVANEDSWVSSTLIRSNIALAGGLGRGSSKPTTQVRILLRAPYIPWPTGPETAS